MSTAMPIPNDQDQALAQQQADGAFARLNPDFQVRYDPDQQRFAQQREAALALGTRVTLMASRENHPDRQQRQTAIAARAATARGLARLRQARADRAQPS